MFYYGLTETHILSIDQIGELIDVSSAPLASYEHRLKHYQSILFICHRKERKIVEKSGTVCKMFHLSVIVFLLQVI